MRPGAAHRSRFATPAARVHQYGQDDDRRRRAATTGKLKSVRQRCNGITASTVASKIERRDRYVQARIFVKERREVGREAGQEEAAGWRAGTDRDSGNAAIATAFPRTAHRRQPQTQSRPPPPPARSAARRWASEAAEVARRFDALATRLIDTAMGANNHQFCGFRGSMVRPPAARAPCARTTRL